jgi:hypothetical protein
MQFFLGNTSTRLSHRSLVSDPGRLQFQKVAIANYVQPIPTVKSAEPSGRLLSRLLMHYPSFQSPFRAHEHSPLTRPTRPRKQHHHHKEHCRGIPAIHFFLAQLSESILRVPAACSATCINIAVGSDAAERYDSSSDSVNDTVVRLSILMAAKVFTHNGQAAHCATQTQFYARFVVVDWAQDDPERYMCRSDLLH